MNLEGYPFQSYNEDSDSVVIQIPTNGLDNIYVIEYQFSGKNVRRSVEKYDDMGNGVGINITNHHIFWVDKKIKNYRKEERTKLGLKS